MKSISNIASVGGGMTWKYLDSTTGNAEITIPADATEVYARAFSGSTSFSFHFLTVEDDISADRSEGYYVNATNYASMLWQWIKSTRKAKMYNFSFAGTDYTSSTTTKWYYKTK